jgi:hypothetical protein
MDDFQHRLIVALERLAGREGGAAGGLEVGERLDALVIVLEEIRDRLADIAEGLPGPPGGGHP